MLTLIEIDSTCIYNDDGLCMQVITVCVRVCVICCAFVQLSVDNTFDQ